MENDIKNIVDKLTKRKYAITATISTFPESEKVIGFKTDHICFATEYVDHEAFILTRLDHSGTAYRMPYASNARIVANAIDKMHSETEQDAMLNAILCFAGDIRSLYEAVKDNHIVGNVVTNDIDYQRNTNKAAKNAVALLITYAEHAWANMLMALFDNAKILFLKLIEKNTSKRQRKLKNLLERIDNEAKEQLSKPKTINI